MNIELLYFEDCPNWRKAERDLAEVIDELSVEADVHLIEVKTNAEAQRLRFAGSPTIRVDGKDIDPAAPLEGFNLECRVYWANGKPSGMPPP